jgi:glycosyltransferase involved in cell wall biosynthesis
LWLQDRSEDLPPPVAFLEVCLELCTFENKMKPSRRKRRVLFIVSTASGYGAEIALFNTIRVLTPDFEPIVIAPENGELLANLESIDVQTRVIPFAVLDRKYFHPLRIIAYKISALLSVLRFLGLFKTLKPEIVHTNNVLVLQGAIAAKLLGIPHVWHVREIIERHHIHPFLWRIWRWVIVTFSTRVICISSSVRSQFGDTDKVVVIHDGVDAKVFQPTRKKRTDSAHKDTPLNVGIVGRLEHRRKGQDIFIEAARIALRSRPDLHFIIAGHERDGIEEQEQVLYEKVKEYELQQKIEFRGFVPRQDMPKLMNELDVLVLCSKQPEGLGIVLLEAMACGKAVVSFAEGGPLDIIVDRTNGLLVPPGNVYNLAQAILELAEKPILRKGLGAEGRKTIEASFRNELTSKKIEDLYMQLLKQENRT